MNTRICTLLLLGLGACGTKTAPSEPRRAEESLSSPTAAPPHAASPAAAAAGPRAAGSVVQPTRLAVVQERNQVCMVNDQYMGREQIPVTVADRTYYGCCPMCKGRLESDASARAAKDPVTGRLVDKSAAVIGRTPSGQVFYFESEDTLRQYKL